MAVTLSGVLKDPYGQPLPGATIRFDAVRTSATVLNHIRAEAITDAQGDYSIGLHGIDLDFSYHCDRGETYETGRGIAYRREFVEPAPERHIIAGLAATF